MLILGGYLSRRYQSWTESTKQDTWYPQTQKMLKWFTGKRYDMAWGAPNFVGHENGHPAERLELSGYQHVPSSPSGFLCFVSPKNLRRAF